MKNSRNIMVDNLIRIPVVILQKFRLLLLELIKYILRHRFGVIHGYGRVRGHRYGAPVAAAAFDDLIGQCVYYRIAA